MPKDSKRGQVRQDANPPYPPTSDPPNTEKPRPVPYACGCGCGKIVHQDLTRRMEQNHIKAKRERPSSETLQLTHAHKHFLEIAVSFDIYRPANIAPNFQKPAQESPSIPMDVDRPDQTEPQHEETYAGDQWSGDSLAGSPNPNGDDGATAQRVLDAWSHQHREFFSGVEVEEEEEEEAAPWMQFVDGEGEPVDGGFDYDRAHEYHLDMGDLDAETEEELERIVAEFKMEIDEDDKDLLRAYNLKHHDNLTEETFAHFAYAFPKHNIASLKVTRKRVEHLSNVSPEGYDCCINTCLLYVGPNEHLTVCPHCKEPRYNEFAGVQKPRKKFHYIPCIERLKSLYENADMIKEMSHRDNYEREDGIFKDVFDGQIYEHLRNTNVKLGDVEMEHKFFDQATDIALGFSTDGFGPFKSRKQTCWPILVYNYNLPPESRFKMENLICVGVIPGPKKPKDMDSFFWPFVFEMLELAIGVKAYHAVDKKFFTLRAYPILAGGDMPAVSAMMLMKGHNGVHPCRMCNIHAVMQPASCRYYVPLVRPKNMPEDPNESDIESEESDTDSDSDAEEVPVEYDPRNLPLRSHKQFIAHGVKVQSAPNATQGEQKAKKYGIKGVPILSQIPSLFFPMSFPFDFMHLLYENVIKNLISFWCGTFKDLDHANKGYRINKTVWEAIGEATQAAGKTTPGAYGPAIPNLSAEGNRITADMYSFWFTFLGPILLEQAFDNPDVYDHFVELVKLINRCLELSITREEVEELREGFIWWVEEYERIYYEYDVDRLSACTSTIHALLHIADGILLLGPVWAYWAFAMERFCGKLARMIHSRRFPFAHLDNQVLASAQLMQIKNKYNLHDELALERPDAGASWQFNIPEAEYSKYALVAPRVKKPTISPNMLHKLAAALVTRFSPIDNPLELIPINDIKGLLSSPETVIEAWGRLRRLQGGDTMLASDLMGSQSEDRRDSTFVRFSAFIDRKARALQGQADYEKKNFYGQLQCVYLLKLPPTPILKLERTTYIALAVIQECKAPVVQHPSGLNMFIYKKLERTEVVDITTVKCLVARAHWLKNWVIYDRGGADSDDDEAGEGGEDEGAMAIDE